MTFYIIAPSRDNPLAAAPQPLSMPRYEVDKGLAGGGPGVRKHASVAVDYLVR
jgi:hypothetical protein